MHHADGAGVGIGVDREALQHGNFRKAPGERHIFQLEHQIVGLLTLLEDVAEEERQRVVPAEQREKGRLKGTAPQHDGKDCALVRNLHVVVRAGGDQADGPFAQLELFLLKMETAGTLHNKVDLHKIMPVKRGPRIARMREDEDIPLQGEHRTLGDLARLLLSLKHGKDQLVGKGLKVLIARLAVNFHKELALRRRNHDRALMLQTHQRLVKLQAAPGFLIILPQHALQIADLDKRLHRITLSSL